VRARASPFIRGKISFLLISLKAGGVGLNLTKADTIILYDPWWNPAVETRVVCRAHRIGQKNQVFAYRLRAKGTINEKILELQVRKRASGEYFL
jgi:SNF2 family DNA or RNA helicase